MWVKIFIFSFAIMLNNLNRRFKIPSRSKNFARTYFMVFLLFSWYIQRNWLYIITNINTTNRWLFFYFFVSNWPILQSQVINHLRCVNARMRLRFMHENKRNRKKRNNLRGRLAKDLYLPESFTTSLRFWCSSMGTRLKM